MESLQSSIWPESELGPKLKSRKEAFNEKLLERVVLSEDELEKYNFPLDKKDLIKIVQEVNKVADQVYLNSKGGMVNRAIQYLSSYNPGVPQMLLTYLSHYFEKNQKDILVSDLMVLKNSLEDIFPEKTDLKKFNKFNSFREGKPVPFGFKQYSLMRDYVESLD